MLFQNFHVVVFFRPLIACRHKEEDIKSDQVQISRQNRIFQGNQLFCRMDKDQLGILFVKSNF